MVFADDFVEIPETRPKDYRNYRNKSRRHKNTLQKRRATAVAVASKTNCAVVVCNEDKENPVIFRRKLGEDELPLVNQYTYLGVEI